MGHIVVAGLDPAIHVFAGGGKKDVDARDKPGHDESSAQAVLSRSDCPSIPGGLGEQA